MTLTERASDNGRQPRITRRTVVKTGTRLAYAAPVVAATYKLTAGGALAATCPSGYTFDPSGPNGPGCYNCQGHRDFDCQLDFSSCPRVDPRACGSPASDPNGYRACVRNQVDAYRACVDEHITAYRSCVSGFASCQRAQFYNPSTNQCETRSGASGGADCPPAFQPVATA